MKILATFLLSLILPALAFAESVTPQEISVGGFFPVENSGRQVYDFNNGWRYHLGDVADGQAVGLDDTAWEIVSTPHTVELLPAEGSGCRNYQGVAWYRKHFVTPEETAGKDVTLHFEAVMGKQKFFVNGKEVKAHLGGYLPVTINLTEAGVKPGEECVVAVMADNSDDKSFPPGKPQNSLDFAYHGGIYRDVWMIAKSPVAINDAVEDGKVAGGGVFVHFDNVSDKSADVIVDTEVANTGDKTRKVTVETSLISPEGVLLKKVTSSAVTLKPGQSQTVTQTIKVKDPQLWSPDSPALYRMESRIKEGKQILDAGATRIGIRYFEFDGEKGFMLNGKPFGQLIGANRHQDFAYVGNAVPNSQQWRDAKRLRDAGCRIIRVAHYPQDPAFMDACDELGMFVIVATPGWQFWNKDPQFAERVHENTRNIIRRDRNHPSVLMWEPILNETRYPENFSLEALQITKDEYPYPG
ncbi:MAG: glycoside hydrolase family 2, partial [Duncaniella sp.]|nr:glycoside hydrolase family 2 [Duncaniella sp.]